MSGAASQASVIATRVWIGLLIASCVAIALYGLSFAAGRAFPPGIAENAAGPIVLLTHAIAAAAALALGPWQFITAIRRRWPAVHRTIGKLYLIACLAGGAAGMALALGTRFGPVARWGFFILGALWVTTAILAYVTVRRRDFSSHRRWMIRSFALAFAAVTLRIYLPASLLSGMPFTEGYPIIAWACWVPNLVVAELYLRLSRDPFPRPGPGAARVTQP